MMMITVMCSYNYNDNGFTNNVANKKSINSSNNINTNTSSAMNTMINNNGVGMDSITPLATVSRSIRTVLFIDVRPAVLITTNADISNIDINTNTNTNVYNSQDNNSVDDNHYYAYTKNNNID